MHQIRVFLSFYNQDKPIADILEKNLVELSNGTISVSRYEDLHYRGSFSNFMDSLKEHDFVFCIVSDGYLKSQACMYEIGTAIKRTDFNEKVLWIIPSDEDQKYYEGSKFKLTLANVYAPKIERWKYVEYWQKKYIEVEEKAKNNPDPQIRELLYNEAGVLRNIYANDIRAFLDYIYDVKGQKLSESIENNFADIFKVIIPEWDNNRFSNCSSIEELNQAAMEEIVGITGTDYNQIALPLWQNNFNSSLIVVADNVPQNKNGYDVVNRSGIFGTCFSSGRKIIANDVDDEPLYIDAVYGTKSEVAIPIMHMGKCIGVINSESTEKNHYSEEMIDELEDVANSYAVSLKSRGFETNFLLSDLTRIKLVANS